MEKYAFVQRLGQGSFAVVWKARRKSDGRLVAVKQLRQSPETWEACKQLPEVRAASAITDRRHVVHLMEAVRHGGELFLVFEYVESSLHACTALGQRIEESQVRWAARRLLAALAAVHAVGLVHCDVKPENILVGADLLHGEPVMKLCDFGQATTPEQIGTYVGTRWYRAPELLLGAKGDAAVDLWAAGCTLAELVLRRPLLPGSDSRDMLFRICGELGPPDEHWPLAARLAEASGRTSAEAAAWHSLSGAGASEAGVQLLAGLLRYDGATRLRADRALREAPFLAPGLPEAPVALPPARPVSPETLRRHRDEATAVEKRLRATGSPAGTPAPGATVRGESPAGLGGPTTRSSPSCEGKVRRDGSRTSLFGVPVSAFGAPCALPGPGAAAGGLHPAAAAAAAPAAAPAESAGASVLRAPQAAAASAPAQGRRQASLPPLPQRASGAAAAGGKTGDDSDDEALAEMFWGACKTGSSAGPAARSTEADAGAEEEAFASQFVAEATDRGRVRRARPTVPTRY